VTSPPWDRFKLGIGDVLVAENGEEAWLAGACVFAEEAPIAALFRAPARDGDLAIYLRALPPFETFWLTFTRSERASPIEPPHSLEEGGVLYSRTRRLPVGVTRHGTTSFDVEGFAIVGEYKGLADERMLRVATADEALYFVGHVLRPGSYDLLPRA